jgi:hypothetical protein
LGATRWRCYSLEKWSIWQPSNSRSKKSRTLSREITTSTGDKLVSEVTIGYVDKIGTITTEDQKTCYALMKIWEENGKPLEETFFSLRRLAKILNKKWGTNVIQATTNSLTRLRAVPLILNNAYYDSISKETLESLETFNILEDLKIIKKKRDGHVTHEGGYFKLNDLIIKNLLNRHSKPVLLNTVLNFRSEIAQLMYTHADLILFRRNRYERRTQELFFDDFGLVGETEYRYKSGRKRRIEKALPELQGIPLTSGQLESVTLKKTEDGKDYKVVFIKNSRELSSDLPRDVQNLSPTWEQIEPELHNEGPFEEQAHELINHFSQYFYGYDIKYPRRKAINQAISLITRYGLETSKFIVEYSNQEAKKSNFDIKTFGGIMQYKDEAMHFYEKKKKKEEADKLKEIEDRLSEQYEKYKDTELLRIRATIQADELLEIENMTKMRLHNEGDTPYFMIDKMIQIYTDQILAKKSNILSFEDWKKSLHTSEFSGSEACAGQLVADSRFLCVPKTHNR